MSENSDSTPPGKFRTRVEPPSPAHRAFMEDLKGTLARHTALSGADMLAVASQFVGQLIALQDQRRFTPEMVMEAVGANIEAGNQAALGALIGMTQGNA